MDMAGSPLWLWVQAACITVSVVWCGSIGMASHNPIHHHVTAHSTFSSSASQPYRTAFHFQPPRNWMNDPAAPMFFKGYYHLFYQYNPYAAVWGNITWGHAISKDLVNWKILELALIPDRWYDLYGCWTGSATFFEPEKPVLLYTGWSNVSFSILNQVQMQAMAIPKDYNDPLLQKWRKVPQNPIIQAPSFINSTKFRDPTTGWLGIDGKWRMLVGARLGEHTGIALVYTSENFISWKLASQPLHSVSNTGMWECLDFYPVLMDGQHIGVDTSMHGQNIMHVLKASFDDSKHDHYTLGTYVAHNDSFLPLYGALDLDSSGLRYDYGKYYASKSFYDNYKGRRILFGWVNESSSTTSDIAKGWASLQAIPRMVWLDGETKRNLLQWPIQEINGLHMSSISLSNLQLKDGSIVEVKGVTSAQMDIEINFRISRFDEAEAIEVDARNVQVICSQIGIARKGIIGPFGLLVLASDDLSEQTALFFYIVSTYEGRKALFCSDQSRSSLANDVDKTSYGSFIPIPHNQEAISLRALVDHSIVEAFAQGGKLCITSRVYPIKAINDAVHLYIFNNGSTSIQVQNLVAWDMASSVNEVTS